MRKNLLGYGLLVLLSTASCFNVDLAGVTLRCDPAQSDSCPEGQTCSASAKVCVSGGQDPIPLRDMASSPDGPAAASGCLSGMGYDVTAAGKAQVFACPAKYSNMSGKTADTQCASGFHLCTNANTVDLAQCNAIDKANGGFFIANVAAHEAFGGGQPACGTATQQQVPLWGGCGRTANTVTLTCQGFTNHLACALNGMFQCKGYTLSDVINTDGNSGVLCCHS